MDQSGSLGVTWIRAGMRAREQAELSVLLCRLERNLLVRRLDIFHRRLNPDLQKMHRLFFRGIEFTVHDAGARGHRLNGVRTDDMALAHAVLVGQTALENIAEDLHVAMR